MTGDPLTVLREALDEAEHHMFGHDAMCRSMFATPGECNCAVQDYKDARAALADVEALIEAARVLIAYAPLPNTIRWARMDSGHRTALIEARAALARFPATSPAKEQA